MRRERAHVVVGAVVPASGLSVRRMMRQVPTLNLIIMQSALLQRCVSAVRPKSRSAGSAQTNRQRTQRQRGDAHRPSQRAAAWEGYSCRAAGDF
ncbi:MAG: hypothetical protein WKH64_04220 [Chloroflexia bacterium]